MIHKFTRRITLPDFEVGKIAAFTLVEILVASSLFIMLLALIFGVMNNSTSIATQATRRMDANRVARECLDLFGRELSMATMPLERGSQTSLQLSMDPTNFLPSPSATLSYTNPDFIFWQAPLAHNRTFGNLAIIGYFVLRDMQSTDSTQWRLQLRRVFVEPGDPAISGTNYQIYSNPNIFSDPYTSGTSWINSIISQFAPASAAADNSNAQSGWVADGVFGMWVRCLDRLGNPITRKAGNISYGLHYESRLGYFQSSASCYYQTALPSYIEVALACMAPRDVANITTLTTAPVTVPANFLPSLDNEGSTPAGYIQQFRAANPRVKSAGIFVRRFRLYGSD